MSAGGKTGGASFDEFAATMDPNVVLHQTPHLPWGGEYVGVEQYADWAAQMSACFEMVDVKNPVLSEVGDKAIVMCTLSTKARKTGETFEHPLVQDITVKEGKITDFTPYYWHVPDYVAAYEGRNTSQAKE